MAAMVLPVAFWSRNAARWSAQKNAAPAAVVEAAVVDSISFYVRTLPCRDTFVLQLVVSDIHHCLFQALPLESLLAMSIPASPGVVAG